MEHAEIDTTELESYKQAEPRDEGQKTWLSEDYCFVSGTLR